MKKTTQRQGLRNAVITLSTFGIVGCSLNPEPAPIVPSMEYADKIRGARDPQRAALATLSPVSRLERYRMREISNPALAPDARARVRFAADGDQYEDRPNDQRNPDRDVVSNLDEQQQDGAEYQVYESSMPNGRDYNGPLSLGDPGVSASLWQESKRETDLFHDVRAWQSLDLITIVVSETSEGTKEADTDIKTESTFQAAIKNFFGYENDVIEKNSTNGKPTIDLENLINASASSEFKGEGETTRKGSLKAKISAMVVEVLPSGIMRVEGEKIIAVNNEEQIMVLSGLVRPRDISSENEIDSSKIANMRIDYFGRGTVGSAQYGGWLSNILRVIWPF